MGASIDGALGEVCAVMAAHHPTGPAQFGAVVAADGVNVAGIQAVDTDAVAAVLVLVALILFLVAAAVAHLHGDVRREPCQSSEASVVLGGVDHFQGWV